MFALLMALKYSLYLKPAYSLKLMGQRGSRIYGVKIKTTLAQCKENKNIYEALI